MKIAILHEMLVKLGGAEKVVESLLRIYPDADLYTLIYDEAQVGKVFSKSKIHSQCHSLVSQKCYNILKRQRLCLPFMKRSVRKIDFSAYDRVIVSSSGFAHGLKSEDATKTIIYYHAPARYMWDWTHKYRRDIKMNTGIKGILYGVFLKNLRMWDYDVAQDNDILLSNSQTTKSRVKKYFRRDSLVVYPPIETQRFAKKIQLQKADNYFLPGEYYIILSALTEFKKLDIAIKAFGDISHTNLLVIGDGEYRGVLEGISKKYKNIKFSGAQYGDDLVGLVQNSLGLIFPGEEDFGIVPIEVMAAGKPVFALRKGGLTETVIEGITGEFFNDSKGEDFIENFNKFHKNNQDKKYNSKDCERQARRFDEKQFHKIIKKIVTDL